MTHNPAEALREALLPCPFCGEAAQIERIGDRSKSTIYSCTYCMCRLETGEEWNHGAGWNKRAAVTPPPSPDVAGVVDADPVRRGRYSGLREAAMFTETLRDNCPAQDKRELLQEIIDEMEWRIEYYKRAARTALTPKEKA
ncbi:MAG: hypothetical protein ACOZAM_14985 [Pseudomonadota bacterium]